MSDKITWIFTKKWDFWLIDWIYVVKGNMKWAISWDKVEALNVSNNPNIITYKIIQVVDETKSTVDILSEVIVEGIYKESPNSKGWYVNLPRKRKWIFIEKWNELWAKSWDKVKILVVKIAWRQQWLVKEILQKQSEQFLASMEFLWDEFSNKNEVNILQVALEEWARIKFPKSVLEEVKILDWNIDSIELQKRKDLRDLFTITIDWADSKDLDDAISVEFLGDDKIKLYVHIADVTNYVKEDKYLDEEALERATSIYLVDKVIPMLPERLSNDLCSLNPNTDKLTLTCEMVIDRNWSIEIEKSKVYESIINTNFRTTYKEIEEIKDKQLLNWQELLFKWEINKDLISLVFIAEKLANRLNSNTRESWELEFDFPETKVIVDKDWNPTWFKPYPKYPSNDWIKAFMVAANRTVSEIYEDKPFLYRTHLTPKEESLEKLQNILAILWVNFKIMEEPTSENFAKLLEEVKWHEKQKFLEKAILVTMQRANYTKGREWHFWLSIDFYSHFTSPIRRYPDLQIHRIIKEIINWDWTEQREKYYNSILDNIAEQCSVEEDKSEAIEKKVNKLMAVKYMSDKIWETFEWFISSINERWVFVELDNTIGWMIDVNKESGAQFNKLCKWLYEFTDEHNDTYNVWDNVKIELVSVNEETLRINFDIIK